MMPLLECRTLSARYGAIQALSGIDVDVEHGEIVCLLGSNGAGKSTLMGAITASIAAGLEGHLGFCGKELLGQSTDSIVKSGIALVPEGRQIFADLTVVDNLRMGAYLRRGKAAVGRDLDGVFEMFPRLRERRRQVCGTLSGGEQQMVAIGRGLMSRPKLLLLDEPSLGLAPLLVKEIMGLIRRINQEGVTVLLVEQNARQALQIAQRGYVLQKGTIVRSGSSRDLLNDPHVVGAYLGA
jgi:branched-chain amino acid transport system ATP-binding protein